MQNGEKMLYDSIVQMYNKFRLLSYRALFLKVREKAGSLSATEAFSVDVINLLGQPTVTQFADYLGISQPNATYKANCLAAKGYLEKISGPQDRRECRLRLSEKFKNYYEGNMSEIKEAVSSLKGTFTGEELNTAARVLDCLLEKL